jgi:hypothetical protein
MLAGIKLADRSREECYFLRMAVDAVAMLLVPEESVVRSSRSTPLSIEWTPRLVTASMCQSGDVCSPLTEGASTMKVKAVGIDLAKNVFQIHCMRDSGDAASKSECTAAIFTSTPSLTDHWQSRGVHVRPFASCHVLEKQTFADFAERPGTAIHALIKRRWE